MKKGKWLWVVFTILALFIVGNLLVSQRRTSADNVRASKKAPDFTLSNLDGETFRFSDLKGKVVILDFWATWCPPCRAEVPHFKSLYSQYKSEDLEVIGIALDQDGARSVGPFVEANQMNYPILIGDQKVIEDYGGIRGIPTTFIIDRQGRIVEKFVGYQDKDIFESAIKKLL